MKPKSTLRLLALLLPLILAACVTVPQDTEKYIFLDESEVLYVDFENSADPRLMVDMPDIAENMRRLRRTDFEVAMTELIELYDLPIEVRLLDDLENPGDGPLLRISASRFGQDTSGDLVVTLHVRLSQYGELNTVGNFNERKVYPLAINDEQLDRAYRELIREPLREVMDDLSERFLTPEERKNLTAPLMGPGE
jgi:hypothetical protein